MQPALFKLTHTDGLEKKNISIARFVSATSPKGLVGIKYRPTKNASIAVMTNLNIHSTRNVILSLIRIYCDQR
jgi:hypothetical protein